MFKQVAWLLQNFTQLQGTGSPYQVSWKSVTSKTVRMLDIYEYDYSTSQHILRDEISS
jgi:hypothetical protein